MFPTCTKLNTLQKLAQKGTAPKVTILYGESGCGKSTAGRIMAMALSCETTDCEKPCGVCDHCKFVRATWEKQQEIDGSCIYVNAGTDGGVNEMKSVARRAMNGRLNPTGNVAILIEEAHNVTSKSKELLLDPTENSPSNVHWFLMTTDIKSLPIALLRRANKCEFKKLSHTDATKLLINVYNELTSKVLSPEICERLINGNTSPGFFLKELEEYLLSGEDKNTLPKVSFSDDELKNPKSSEDVICSNFLMIINLFANYKQLSINVLMGDLTNAIISKDVSDFTGLRFRLISTIKTMIGKKIAKEGMDNIAPNMPAYAEVIAIIGRKGYPFVVQAYDSALFLSDAIKSINTFCTG